MSYYEYIYIAGNDVDVNLYKIGKTTKNPFERVKSLNTSGVAHQLHLKKYYIVTDAHTAEKLIHESLSNWRIRSDREFFSINLEYADRIIRTVLNSNNLVFRPDSAPANNYTAPYYEINNYHGHVISNKRLVLFVCILCGWFGVHHLVWGKISIGLLYLFTFGFFGIGWIFDIIRIASGKSDLIAWTYDSTEYYETKTPYQQNYNTNFNDTSSSFIPNVIRENYSNNFEERLDTQQSTNNNKFETDKDNMLDLAAQVVLNQGYASVSVLVRYLGVKYPQAVQLLDEMEEKGFIGPFNGADSREILIDKNSYINTIKR